MPHLEEIGIGTIFQYFYYRNCFANIRVKWYDKGSILKGRFIFIGGVVLPKGSEEVLVKLPINLFIEVDGMAKHENKDINDIIYQATKNYINYKKETRQLHESMQKGYEEMAGINLNLCSEAFLAEEEAKITSDRLVIGV